jgi:hypothetical protein
MMTVSISAQRLSGVRSLVPRDRPGWELSEETMPEAVLHDENVRFLWHILAAWAAEHGPCLVVRNLAIRWDEERPQVGLDPDVAVIKPPPPEGDGLRSLKTWNEGHQPPLLAAEIVSETNSRKDYLLAPEKYAASGTQELWVFDPLLCAPGYRGGPFRLQIWNRDERGDFVRTYAGDGPARSKALDAYLVVVAGGRKLRLARDPAGMDLWLTAEESQRAAKEKERAEKEWERAEKERERAEKERERAAKEQERAAKEAAFARIRELEAELASRSRSG